jgi:Secretin and TonB N terminus short domain
MLKTLMVGIVLLIGVIATTFAQDTTEHQFDVPQQDLGPALAALARQGGFQIVYSARLVAGKTSQEVKGTLTLPAALDRLLRPVGLQYEFIDPQTVMLSMVPVRATQDQAATKEAASQSNAVAGDAHSQAGKSSETPTVTVISPPLPDPRDLQGHSVPDFVRSHSQPEVLTGSLARWDVGICPHTEGLAPELNSFISQRVAALALHVGVTNQDTVECERHKSRGEFALDPNVLILFTREPQKLLDDIAAHHYELLGFHYPHQTYKLKRIERPIQAWYVTATRGAGGKEWVDNIFGTVPPGSLASRLTTGRQSLFVFVLIVADVDKIQGYTVGSLADYIAVLALSQLHSPQGCDHLSSILDLLSSGCNRSDKPQSITASDVAYLTALSHMHMGLGLFLERSDIENQMMRQLLPHSDH